MITSTSLGMTSLDIMDKLRVAIVQAKPAFLQLEASLKKVESFAEKAAKKGAKLIVFGETWLPGYPAWLDFCPNMGFWDHEPTKEVFAKTFENSLEVPGPEVDRIANLAKKLEVAIVIGINERVATGTLYNSLLSFGPAGELLNHHRKLMPTYTEKLIHTTGDAAGLKVVELPFAKLGGLICWEHWMPHTRQALHDMGEMIHIAVWPTVHEMHQIASRHYAFEGRCFVLAAGQILQAHDIPEELELPKHLKKAPDTYVLKGGSCIIGPNGHYITEPVWEEESLIYADLDLREIIKEKMNLDVSGHYSRPDVFNFTVNRARKND